MLKLIDFQEVHEFLRKTAQYSSGRNCAKAIAAAFQVVREEYTAEQIERACITSMIVLFTHSVCILYKMLLSESKNV